MKDEKTGVAAAAQGRLFAQAALDEVVGRQVRLLRARARTSPSSRGKEVRPRYARIDESMIGGLEGIRLERMARLNGHRPGSLLAYVRQAFGVSRLAEIPVGDLPDVELFVRHPPKEMVQKREPRPRPETRRDRRARIRRRVDRLMAGGACHGTR